VLLAATLLLFADATLVVRRWWRRARAGDARSSPTVAAAVEVQQPERPAVEAVAIEPAPADVAPHRAAALAVPTDRAVARRTFLGQAAAGSALLVASGSSLYGALSGRHDYAIEDFPLRLPGLSRRLDGFTIAQLSDVHIGHFVGEAELAAAEELVRKVRADLIVLTGDLLDNDARLAPVLGRFARRLATLSREGVVAITGNHDFYAGVDAAVGALRSAGASVLRNEGLTIGGRGGFALLGVDDVWGSRYGAGPDLERALSGLPGRGDAARGGDQATVLLCHNPSYFEAAAGKVGLQLSGHTHGGQISPLVNPAALVLRHGWVRGPYQRQGSTLYVNRGFGVVGPPARLGSPPEVTRIVLSAG
jgi:predicted MPP superfamily phosphohydrolase